VINCSNLSGSIPGNLGTILHLNGRGCLHQRISTIHTWDHSKNDVCHWIAHITFLVENLGSTVISTPFSSRGFNILNTANTLAITDHTDVSAKCLPTQICQPNPNAMCPMSLGLRELSLLRNRLGTNTCGLGYLDSSCAIALTKRFIKSCFGGV